MKTKNRFTRFISTSDQNLAEEHKNGFAGLKPMKRPKEQKQKFYARLSGI
jgi:hypothetical protein